MRDSAAGAAYHTRMQALGKAGVVMRAFTPARPQWGVRSLAEHLGWPRTTTHAYLSGLTEAGFLRRMPRGQYRLSWNLVEFSEGLTGALPWFTQARLALAELAQATRSLGFLCVLEGGRVVCINRALGDLGGEVEADHARIQTDVTLPANATAAGKVLYAHAPLPLPTFERYTPGTITTPDEWAGELARVRENGHAHAIEEWLPGHCAVGVPLWWEGEVVAAFGIQLPTSRYLVRERRLLEAVQRSAQGLRTPIRPD